MLGKHCTSWATPPAPESVLTNRAAFLQVICVGQIVCAVAADTYAHAKEAAKHVKIAYDDIEPAIITIEVEPCPSSGIAREAYFEQNSTRRVMK